MTGHIKEERNLPIATLKRGYKIKWVEGVFISLSSVPHRADV